MHSPVSCKRMWKDGPLCQGPCSANTVRPRQAAHPKLNRGIFEEPKKRGSSLESRAARRKVEIFSLSIISPLTMNFDELLSAIGGFGKYQKILYIWICLPQVLLSLHMMASIFTGATPPHQCRGDSGNHSLSTGTEALNFSLRESSCSSISASPLGNRTERVPCGHGWVYSRDTFQSTTVTEVGCWRGAPLWQSLQKSLQTAEMEESGEETGAGALWELSHLVFISVLLVLLSFFF